MLCVCVVCVCVCCVACVVLRVLCCVCCVACVVLRVLYLPPPDPRSAGPSSAGPAKKFAFFLSWKEEGGREDGKKVGREGGGGGEEGRASRGWASLGSFLCDGRDPRPKMARKMKKPSTFWAASLRTSSPSGSSTPPVRTCCLLFFSLGRRHLLCGRVACCFSPFVRRHLLCGRVACCFSPLVVDTSCADVLPVVFLPWSSTPPVRTCCLLFFSLGRRHLMCGRIACCFSPLVVNTSSADVLPVVFLPWSSTPPLPTCCLLFFSLGRQQKTTGNTSAEEVLTTKGEKQQATRRQRRC